MFDFTELITSQLEDSRRSTGLLHCSSHLAAPIRHTQLYWKHRDDPPPPMDFMGSIRMFTGTMWHERIEKWLAESGIPFMSEVDVTMGLPALWTGRADYLIWDDEQQLFQLYDLKTIKGEGVKWLGDSPKEEHVWQVSAYLHALLDMGIPVSASRAFVYYLPMNPVMGESVEPVLIPFTPLDYADVQKRMRIVEDSLEKPLVDYPNGTQKIFKNKVMGVEDVKVVPHWTSQFCPYPEECGCADQRPFKIGHYRSDGVYIPRKGYEDWEVEV